MPLHVEEFTTPTAIAASYDLMRTLRDRIARETYVAEIERQRREGYRLFGGHSDGALVALAGVRRTHTLARGDHVFIDDLVVVTDRRGQGLGRAMMEWLADWTAAQPCGLIYLDSRNTAKGFYEAIGFKFLTSLPCFVTPEILKTVR